MEVCKRAAIAMLRLIALGVQIILTISLLAGRQGVVFIIRGQAILLHKEISGLTWLWVKNRCPN